VTTGRYSLRRLTAQSSSRSEVLFRRGWNSTHPKLGKHNIITPILYTIELKLLTAAAGLIALLLTVTAATAQQVYSPQDVLSAGVTVHVYGPDNRPLKRQAFVTLYQRGSSMQLGTVMTTVSSEAAFSGMPSYGPYTVEVKAAGYQTERKDFDYNLSSGRIDVDVVMHPLSAAGNEAPTAPPLSPKAEEHMQKGLKAMQTGKFEDAQTEFMAAHKIEPQNADVCYWLGAAYKKGGDLQNAEAFLEKATALDPDHVMALVALGQVRDQQKNYQAAIAPLEKAAALDGKEWLARWVLADAYLHTADYEKALKDSQAAIELGKGAATKAELIEGQALANLGRRDEAIQILESFIHDVPNDPAVRSVRAFIARLQSAAPEATAKPN
jgi:Flp pilus assembly protein TadD